MINGKSGEGCPSPLFFVYSQGVLYYVCMTRTNVPDDSVEIASIVEDLRKGLRFVREAQGYGELVLRIVVKPGGIAEWEVGPVFRRKPHWGQGSKGATEQGS